MELLGKKIINSTKNFTNAVSDILESQALNLTSLSKNTDYTDSNSVKTIINLNNNITNLVFSLNKLSQNINLTILEGKYLDNL